MTEVRDPSLSFVVLAKEVREAKSRLGLEREPAGEIALSLAQRTVQAALEATSSGAVFVVTSDRTIARVATGLGAMVVWEGRPVGMNRAAAMGRERAFDERPTDPVAILVADLPRLRPHELDAAAEEFCEHRAPMYVPDHHRVGTTFLVHGPDSRPGIAFGRNSAHMHSRLGYEPARGALHGLRADLDTPEDLQVLMAGKPHSLATSNSTHT